MKLLKFFLPLFICSAIIISCGPSEAPSNPSVSFSISMDDPGSHYYLVQMHCSELSQDNLTLRLPAWTPGYYMVLNLAQHIVDFSPKDSAANPLEWTKTDKNAWQINTKGVSELDVQYYVYANRRSVAEPYLDSLKGFISPTGIFMHPEKIISIPVKISINPWTEWTQVSTGLAAFGSERFTYQSKDFDELYDCPILVGNQTVAEFEVEQVPHYLSIENAGSADLERLKSDVKRIVQTSTELMGEIPYEISMSNK